MPPSYTVRGKGEIDGFIDELENALPNPFIIKKKKENFHTEYRKDYIKAWFAFAKAFPKGSERLVTRTNMNDAILKMGTGEGPYFSLLSIMLGELKPIIDQEAYEYPFWIGLLIEFDEIKKDAKNLTSKKTAGVMGRFRKKALGKIKSKAGKAGKAARFAGGSSGDPKTLAEAAQAFNDYQTGLAGIRDASVSPASAFQMTSAAFVEDPATGKAHVFAAKRSVKKIIRAMGDPRSHASKAQKKIIAGLIKGPLGHLWNFANRETSCHIQVLWEESVTSKTEGVGGSRLADLLLGENGYATVFAAETIKPFLGRSGGRGFYSKKIEGERMPFIPNFLRFLTRGELSSKIVEDTYRTTLTARKTDVNAGAEILPHLTVLEVDCPDGVQTLKNYQYPASKTFKWSPEACGDVSLTIHVGNLAVVKRYSGDMAFARFLRDFSRGFHTFGAHEFGPDHEAALKRNGIDWIKIKFDMTGHGPVIRLINITPRIAPDLIVWCALKYCRNNLSCIYR